MTLLLSGNLPKTQISIAYIVNGILNLSVFIANGIMVCLQFEGLPIFLIFFINLNGYIHEKRQYAHQTSKKDFRKFGF